MPNRQIRARQSANSKKINEEGKAFICQRRFPAPTQPTFIRYRSDREIARRKRQIDRGQITASNGLVVSSPAREGQPYDLDLSQWSQIPRFSRRPR